MPCSPCSKKGLGFRDALFNNIRTSMSSAMAVKTAMDGQRVGPRVAVLAPRTYKGFDTCFCRENVGFRV